jgi:hypothetical protein
MLSIKATCVKLQIVSLDNLKGSSDMIPFTELEKTLKPTNSPESISEATGIPVGTLGYWRSSGIGPKFSKIGKTVLYAKEDILNYLRDNRFQSTQETKEAPATTETSEIK